VDEDQMEVVDLEKMRSHAEMVLDLGSDVSRNDVELLAQNVQTLSEILSAMVFTATVLDINSEEEVQSAIVNLN